MAPEVPKGEKEPKAEAEKRWREGKKEGMGEKGKFDPEKKSSICVLEAAGAPNAAKEGCQLLYTLFLGSTESLGHDFISTSAFL